MITDLRTGTSTEKTPVGAATLFDNGVKTAAFNIDLSKGQEQLVTIDATALALTFTPPTGVCTVRLHIKQGATGGAIIFPSALWEGGVVGANTLTPNVGYDILTVNFTGGTDYQLSISKGYV